MCSEFLKRMDNYHQGDLADIVRASGGSMSGGRRINSVAELTAATSISDYNNPIINCYSDDNSCDDFGDPFYHMGDPLFRDDIHNPVSVSGFFNGQNIIIKSNNLVHGTASNYRGFESTGGGYNNCSIINENDVHHKLNLDHIDEMRRSVIPSDIFSIRMLQISPPPRDSPVVVASAGSPPRGLINASSMLLSNNHTQTNNGSKVCLVENPAGLQISSPRNTGIKRRKSQAKKVVCIPAPAPANTRHSGEVVPSDLWAWRKYGQKPIKGSPYPRGYYRCSSSKGCSARKQVERSRTDPNMLVITYTSEHNHPWPTQRNALAGSTRSHPIKNNSVPKNTTNSDHHAQKSNEEQKEITTLNTTDDHKNTTAVLKEETDQDFENDQLDDAEFDEGFRQSYKPTIPPDSDHSEDFFADLGEIEADPLDLSFTDQGFSGDNVKALDPFTFYDNWTATNNQYSAAFRNNTATTSYGEAKKDS